LLKAAIIAAGIVPPGIEGSGESLSDVLAAVVGPGASLFASLHSLRFKAEHGLQ
jgi:hypothetical protein